MSARQDPAPDGTYPVELECCKCHGPIYSFTEANLSDPDMAAMVQRLQRMLICDRCAMGVKSHKATQIYLGDLMR